MAGSDPLYQEVLDDSEELESDGHVTMKGRPYNFMKFYRDDKVEYHPNRFFSAYKFLVDGSAVDTPDAAEKAENVEKLAEMQEELGINHPALIYSDGNYSEFEFIPGETLERELDRSPEDLMEIGEEIGRMTANLHSSDFARYDNRAANIIVDRSGLEDNDAEPFFIDSEYVETEAEQGDKNLDLVSFIDSTNDREQEIFEELFGGFSDGYGEIPYSSIGLAGIRTTAERAIEKDVSKSVQAIRNTLTAFYINATNDNS